MLQKKKLDLKKAKECLEGIMKLIKG